mmetsp:Transcript_25425/g.39214  ORF Transcript_25425/g.39214 Transcript_25425/m.39214 type:complete len:156 (-) Transcript_25425:1202-1669(-)
MESQLEKLKEEVKQSYAAPEFQKYLYSLHSICVHEGSGDSGHYYSFIFDRFTNQWWKYSDIRIEKVTEEQVFKVAEGDDQSWASAFYLVYIKKEVAATLAGTKINVYSSQQKSAYSELIIPTIQQKVETENKALEDEIARVIAEKEVDDLRKYYD